MHASVAGLLSEKQAFLTSKVKQPIFNGTSFVSYRTIDNSGVYSHVEFGRTCSQDSTDCTCFMQKTSVFGKNVFITMYLKFLSISLRLLVK